MSVASTFCSIRQAQLMRSPKFTMEQVRSWFKLGHENNSIFMTIIALVFCLAACSTSSSVSVRQSGNDLSVVLLASIHEEALSLVRKYQTSPLRAARMLAYLDSAVLETNQSIAVSGAKASGCEHVAYMLASYAVLAHFFPLETPGRLLSRPRLLPDWNATNCDEAKRLAEVATQATIARAMRDGANPPKKVRAHPGRAVGLWEPTPPLFSANPTEPYAGEWITMVIGNPSQLRLLPPPSVTSAEYKSAMDEALRVAANLSPTEKEVAEKWNLEAGSITPAGVWNMRLQQIVKEERLSDQRTIEIYSVVNTAMFDALIACSYEKYVYWTERPITAALRLGKSEFKPVLVTPSFPAYPSGHACASGAAARVIGTYLPSRNEEVTALANEAAESRVYGGIHFRFDVEAGLRLGEQVGDKVVTYFALRR